MVLLTHWDLPGDARFQARPAPVGDAEAGGRRDKVAPVRNLREAGRRRLPLLIASGALAAVVVAGCGEKSEPAVHPPTTAATTTTAPTTTAPPATTTRPGATPTAPVPKTTP
jgi:hypothetical protein